MYMDEGMDTGDMILKQEVDIGENETTGELWDRLSKIGGELLVETLKQIDPEIVNEYVEAMNRLETDFDFQAELGIGM